MTAVIVWMTAVIVSMTRVIASLTAVTVMMTAVILRLKAVTGEALEVGRADLGNAIVVAFEELPPVTVLHRFQHFAGDAVRGLDFQREGAGDVSLGGLELRLRHEILLQAAEDVKGHLQ